jgi:DNA-binding NarL/FixJ family response regulator
VPFPSIKRPLRILHLEECLADAERVSNEIGRAGMRAIVERVDSEEAYGTALTGFVPDVVLSDHSLDGFDAETALRVLQSLRPTAPLILVTEAVDECLSTSALRAGAEDLVLKRNLSRLVPAIESALAVRQRLEKLSPRQLEVLRLVAEGFTTREIGERLKLSAKTIETHRGEVMKRLGIHDVAGLVRYALRVKLVPPMPN